MKQLYLFSFFTFFSSFCILSGQQSKIDSLIVLNEKHIEIDSIKLSYLFKITSYYQNNSINLAEKYNDSLFQNAKKIGDIRFELLSKIQKGTIAYRKSNFNLAVSIWKDGLSNKKIESYPIQHANLLNNIALGYKVLKEKDSVLIYMHKAVDLNKKNNNETGLIGNYYSLADFYSSNDDFDKSIINIKKLQEIAIKTGNDIALARSFIILAKISRLEFDYADSEKYFDKAYNIYKESQPDNIVFLSALAFESATSTMLAKKHEEAIDKYLKIKSDFSSTHSDESFWRTIDGYLLYNYNELGLFKEAELTYNKLIALERHVLNSFSHNGIILNNLSRHEILSKKTNQKTLNRLIQIINEKKNSEDLQLISSTYKNISEYYNLIGDDKKAYLNFNKYNILRDSITINKSTAINLSLKRKFNEELKEKEIEKLRANNAEQNLLMQKEKFYTRLFAICLFFTLLFSAMLLYYLKKQKKQNMVEEYKYLKEVERLKESREEELFKKSQKIDELNKTIFEKDKFFNSTFEEKESLFHNMLSNKYLLGKTKILLQYWIDQSNGLTEKDMMKLYNKSSGGIDGRRKRLYAKIKEVEDIDSSIWLTREDATRIYRENWQNFNK